MKIKIKWYKLTLIEEYECELSANRILPGTDAYIPIHGRNEHNEEDWKHLEYVMSIANAQEGPDRADVCEIVTENEKQILFTKV